MFHVLASALHNAACLLHYAKLQYCDVHLINLQLQGLYMGIICKPALYTAQCCLSSDLRYALCLLRCTMLPVLLLYVECCVHAVGLRPVHYTAQSSLLFCVQCFLSLHFAIFPIICPVKCSLSSVLHNTLCPLRCAACFLSPMLHNAPCSMHDVPCPLHFAMLSILCAVQC